VGSIGGGPGVDVAVTSVRGSCNGTGIIFSMGAMAGVAIAGGWMGRGVVVATGLGAIVLITGTLWSVLSLDCSLMSSVGVSVGMIQLSVVWQLEHWPRG
jgi:hypothetical protein